MEGRFPRCKHTYLARLRWESDSVFGVNEQSFRVDREKRTGKWSWESEIEDFQWVDGWMDALMDG